MATDQELIDLLANGIVPEMKEPAPAEPAAEEPAEPNEPAPNPEEPSEPAPTPEPAPAPEGTPEAKVASPDYSFIDGFIEVEEKSPEKIREALQTKFTELQDKIKLLSEAPVSTFQSETVRMFNEFVKETGREDFGLFQKIQSATVSNDDSIEKLVDVIVMKEVFDDPSKESVRDALRQKLITDYTVELDEDSTANEKALAQLKRHELMGKANEAVGKFGEVLTKIKEASPKPIDADALKLEKDERIKKWEPIVNQNLDKLKVQVPKFENKDGNIKYLDESLIEVNFDDKDKAEYANLFRSFVAANNAPEPSEEVLAQAHSFAYKEAVFKKIPQLVADAYAKGISETTKKTLEEAENPSALRAEQKSSGGDSLADLGKAFLKDVLG